MLLRKDQFVQQHSLATVNRSNFDIYPKDMYHSQYYRKWPRIRSQEDEISSDDGEYHHEINGLEVEGDSHGNHQGKLQN